MRRNLRKTAPIAAKAAKLFYLQIDIFEPMRLPAWDEIRRFARSARR
jgi:hypothetical protein